MQLLFYRSFIIILFLFPVLSLAQNNKAELLVKVEGFSHPESVVFDSINKVLYVSNIGEKEQGDGFISKMGVKGEILSQKWIKELNDPKGMLLRGNFLYVTDNTDLVIIDIDKNEIIERIQVEGAGFLNDIAEGPAGTIYVSDTRNSSIFKRDATGLIHKWMNTPQLEYPNGLLVVDNDLYVAAWGREEPGNVLRVNLDSKEIEKVSNLGLGNLDGIQRVNKGEFYVSDWATGRIYLVSENKESIEIITSQKSAGDILYLKDLKQIVIPMNIQNEVWWYQLPEN